ncbi:MAG: H4MPT-linked C1 transfer pathway protein [Gemmataceae bacterium]
MGRAFEPCARLRRTALGVAAYDRRVDRVVSIRMGQVVVPTLGLDIGGAHLKAAHCCGQARCRPFALWRNPSALAQELAALLEDWPDHDRIAVTMTGELCDCFANKRQGIAHILESLQQALRGRRQVAVRVWTTSGRFVPPAEASRCPLSVAAANWHALATWAARLWPQGRMLVLDIGSTTTDIVPCCESAPIPAGWTDRQRLATGELVYTGVRRTPVPAVVSKVACGGRYHRIAAEWFATMLDVYLLLDELPEVADDRETADGRPATKEWAWRRLARLLAADEEECTPQEARHMAVQIRAAQMELIAQAVHQVIARWTQLPDRVCLSGSGEFLGRSLLSHLGWNCAVVALSDYLGASVSVAACAYAVAQLAAQSDLAS